MSNIAARRARTPDGPPRILFLGHGGVLGGAELSVLPIARRFRDTATFVLFADGPFRERLEHEGVCVQLMPGGSLHAMRRESRIPRARTVLSVGALARRVAGLARRYDLLYANTQKAFIVGCAASLLSRRPLLWHLRDILSREHFSAANIRLDAILANHVAKRVVAISHAVRDAFIASGGAAERVHVVHNGIDGRAFLNVSMQEAEAARRQLGLQLGQPVIGCIGRISPWKGQHLVIRALAGLPGAHVLLAGGSLFGETAYEAELRELAAYLGVAERVHFLGVRSDVAVLMTACDVIVHSSVAPEPFGRVLVEAMLAARPLVAPRAGGVVEIVDDGVTGMLYEQGDADGLRDAVAAALADPQRALELGNAARRHALRRFSVERMLRAIEDQVRGVLGAPVELSA
jgi:glycosyltransferase involved in cell wall biosynthesis